MDVKINASARIKQAANTSKSTVAFFEKLTKETGIKHMLINHIQSPDV